MFVYINIIIAFQFCIIVTNVICVCENSFRNRWKVAQNINHRKVDKILVQYFNDHTHIGEIKKKLLSNCLKVNFLKDNEVSKDDNLENSLVHKGGVWEYSPAWSSYLVNNSSKPIGTLKFENYYKISYKGKNIHFAIYYTIDIYRGKYNLSNNSAVPDKLGGQVWLSMHPIWPTRQFQIGAFELEPDVGHLLYDQTTGPLSDHLKRHLK